MPSRPLTNPSVGESFCACAARSPILPTSPRKIRWFAPPAAGRTLRKFAPALIEALQFRAARAGIPCWPGGPGCSRALTGPASAMCRRRPDAVPQGVAPLVMEEGGPNRRLYETAVLATLRDKLRSGDIWVERSSNYRRFDSYLLPAAAVPPVAAELGLPATADEWLADARARARPAAEIALPHRLQRGELDGVELRDGRLHVTPVKAATPPEARAFADRLDALLPRVRITETAARGQPRRPASRPPSPTCAPASAATNENALLAAILADATNLGLGADGSRPATASPATS